ncbi:MAG: hypothetical protein ABJO86_05525 [Lentilitoribacter sp.]
MGKKTFKFVMMLAGFCFLLLTQSFAHAKECNPQNVDFSSETDVYFSEFRVSLDRSTCPTVLNDLNEPIALKSGQHAQFWFRLQGSAKYASSLLAKNSFVARYFQKFESGFAKHSLITISGINRQMAYAEALNNEGRFDWRFWIRKKVFAKPGEYALVIYQNGEQICLINSEADPKCSFRFMVTQ